MTILDSVSLAALAALAIYTIARLFLTWRRLVQIEKRVSQLRQRVARRIFGTQPRRSASAYRLSDRKGQCV